MKLLKFIQPIIIVGLLVILFSLNAQVEELSAKAAQAEKEAISERQRAEALSELAQRNAAEAHIAAAEAEKQRKIAEQNALEALRQNERAENCGK